MMDSLGQLWTALIFKAVHSNAHILQAFQKIWTAYILLFYYYYIYIYTHTCTHTHTHYIYRGCFFAEAVQSAINRTNIERQRIFTNFWTAL